MKRPDGFLSGLFYLLILLSMLPSCGGDKSGTKAEQAAESIYDVDIAEIDSYVTSIEQSTELLKKSLDYESGNRKGTQTAFFHKGVPVKIVVKGQKPDGTLMYSYYYFEGQLVLAHIEENMQNCHGDKLCVWDKKHYFSEGRLLKSVMRGDAFMPGEDTDLNSRSFVPNKEDPPLALDSTQTKVAFHLFRLFSDQKK